MLNNYYTVKKRLLSILVATIFLFCVIIFRLFYIQIVWGKNLQAIAMEQWARSLPLSAERGRILDTNGTIIVDNMTAYTVYVRAKSVTDPDQVAETLSKVLDLNYNTVYSKVTNKGVSETTIKRQVTAEEMSIIRSQNLDGVYMASETTRIYPYGDFLTQVLGFVSVDGVGQSGIESYYDKYLSGIDGKILTQTDLIGVEIDDEEIMYLPAVAGYDVVLTIDYAIQSAVEYVLDFIMQAHSPISAKCIVMDVTSGEILAMAINPSYDMNDIPRDDVETLMELSRNSLITDIYEPGSTFKVITVSADLEEVSLGNTNAYDENHIFSSSGVRYVDGGKISCWTKHINGKHSNQNIAMALNNSCNPVFTDIALALGADTFYGYLEKFGFGQTTGIDFAGEQSGLLVSLDTVTQGDLARIGFGQTIAITPIQLCTAVAAAVNGGILYQPYLVKEIVDSNTGSVVKSFGSVVKGRAISEETSKKIAEMLEGVVTNGSGKQCYIEGYQVGGKTGTAQKYIDGVVAQGKNISSFVGFFPASSPKYLCLVMVDEPVGITYGSVVAAPYAKLIFEFIINYYDLEPCE
ncbi:MAG TPA: penicillin-binding transpeptidase domain-containing protein [Clostridia bacterium]|nr:penicillin-binding transpeptidase domain-containing protein [Clostridia bacterium]